MGCGGGGSSYDAPPEVNNSTVAGSATNVLIEPETLKNWIDDDLVGNESDFGAKVVILDFGAYDLSLPADEQTERIQGSCRVERGMLTGLRFEGVADATPLVATGAQMDAVIQRLGIEEDTTIVFTTDVGNAGYFTTRAYWTFRYWGFPREQLKVLNGGNTAFAAAYPGLMTQEIPAPTPSTFSVRDLAGINDDLRASVGEMIEIIKTLPSSTTDMVFDARGDSYYNGTKATAALITGDVVVVDGHPEAETSWDRVPFMLMVFMPVENSRMLMRSWLCLKPRPALQIPKKQPFTVHRGTLPLPCSSYWTQCLISTFNSMTVPGVSWANTPTMQLPMVSFL